MKCNFAIIAMMIILSSCTTDEQLPGKRLSVFDLEKKLKVASKQELSPIKLPAAKNNIEWAQIGVNAAHNPQNLNFGNNAKEIWRIQAGEDGDVPFVSPPIIAQNKIFVLDGENVLRSFDIKTGKMLWQKSFYVEGAFGGGIAYSSGRIFIASGSGTIAALASSNGDVLWRQELRISYRSAPIVAENKVFFMSFNNQLSARDVLSGKEVWNHLGISETSSLLITSAVAVANNIVIAPYNSGEVFAMRADNKEFVWTNNLLRQGLALASANSDFIAVPAIDKNRVYVISNSDYIVAINLQNGKNIWSQHISGVNMPWVAGKQIYVLSNDNWLLCLSTKTGFALWRTKLPQEEDGLVWHGPVLTNRSLWLTSSNGKLIQISAITGKIIKTQQLSNGFGTAPIIAAKRMFLLSANMELIALQPAP